MFPLQSSDRRTTGTDWATSCKVIILYYAADSAPVLLCTVPLTSFFKYRASHRVDRVLGFFASHPNWDSPTPSPAASQAGVSLNPVGSGGGEGYTNARGRGGGGSQFRRGDRHCGTLGIYVLCSASYQKSYQRTCFIDRYFLTNSMQIIQIFPPLSRLFCIQSLELN